MVGGRRRWRSHGYLLPPFVLQIIYFFMSIPLRFLLLQVTWLFTRLGIRIRHQHLKLKHFGSPLTIQPLMIKVRSNQLGGQTLLINVKYFQVYKKYGQGLPLFFLQDLNQLFRRLHRQFYISFYLELRLQHQKNHGTLLYHSKSITINLAAFFGFCNRLG